MASVLGSGKAAPGSNPLPAGALSLTAPSNGDNLSWAGSFTKGTRQNTASLCPQNWQTVAQALAVSHGPYTVSVSAWGNRGYLRLVITNL